MALDGQTLEYLQGNGAPLAAHELGVAAAAMISGLHLSHLNQPLDFIDSEGLRKFVWSFNGEDRADFAGERLSLNEFVARFNDPVWREANKDHPIAYMSHFWDLLKLLSQQMKGRKPAAMLRKTTEDGDSESSHTAIIPHDAPPEEVARIMEAYEAA